MKFKITELSATQAACIVFLIGVTTIVTMHVYDTNVTNNQVDRYYSDDGYIELRADGSFIVVQKHGFGGEYIIEGDNLTLYYGFGKFEAKIKKDRIIDGDGDIWMKNTK